MSLGQIIGGVVGGAIGWWLGGPTGAMMGASLGAGIGGIVDPLEPDIPSPGQPDIANLDMVTAQEGTVVVDFVGTSKMAGNIFYYSNARVEEITEDQETGGKGGSSSKEVVVGLKYYLTWAVGLALGPIDELYTVLSNDKVVWSGNLLRSDAIDGKSTITLDNMGSMTLYFGGTDQTPESVIGSDVGSTVNPSYRGLTWAFFNDCNLGNYNRAPTIRFVMRKTPVISFSPHNILNVYDYNPAHAIWYILENLCELNPNWMNPNVFAQFASDLSDSSESRGVSILFKHDQAERYISSILQHVQGIMPYGDDTGQFEPKLLRSTTAVSGLTLITDDDCLEPPDITSMSYMDTFNDVKVQYSQLYDFESGKPVPSYIFTPDDEFDYIGTAATDKWSTFNITVSSGPDDGPPEANGNSLYFSGTKTIPTDGESYKVVVDKYFIPGKQREFEIQFKMDYDTLFTTSTSGTAKALSAFIGGITTSAGSILGNVDHHVLGRGPLNAPSVYIQFFGGVGNGGGGAVNDPDYFPIKFKLRNERHPTNSTNASNQSFYNNINAQWESSPGIPGEWQSTYESIPKWYPVMRFTTETTELANCIVAGGYDWFRVMRGCICANDFDALYSTGFAGTTGSEKYWVVGSSGVKNERDSGFYWLSVNSANKTADAAFQISIETSKMFKVRFNYGGASSPGINLTAGNIKRGVQITDQVNSNKYFIGQVSYGGTANFCEMRYWNGATWNIEDSYYMGDSNNAIIEFERSGISGNAGTIYGYASNGLFFNSEFSVQSQNEFGLEMIAEASSGASFAGTYSVQFDDFWFDYMENSLASPAVEALDIRQASVHAEDIGNKEVMNRIRHKDERMMLFTRDENARWGAGQAIRTTSVPLRTIDMKMDRRGIFLPVGNNFRYKSSQYGVDREIIFRVLNVKEGDLAKEEFAVRAIEDANYLTQLIVVDEADRDGTKYNPFLTDIQNADVTEAPYAMVEQSMYLVPLIGRKNGNEIGYYMYMSIDGTTYSKQASLNKFVTAGCLAATLPTSEAVLDNHNILSVDFLYDPDAQSITSISRAEMISGKNLAVMVSGATQEIISFEDITPDSTVIGRYHMNNLYRARYDTEQYNWPSNSKFYFIGAAPPLVFMPALVKGNTRYFKFVFYNTLKAGDISAAEAIPKLISGRAWTPKTPGGFRANNLSENSPGGPVYTSGITLSWNPEIRGTGAGRQDPDVVVDSFPTWEGLFEIVGLISGATAFTDTAIDAVTSAYTAGQLKGVNGGSLPDQIQFKLTNYINTEGVRYQSPYTSIIVNKE